MEIINVFNQKYLPRIIKKQEGNTVFLMDTSTGALFSQSDTGIITFQDMDGNKWVYTDHPIDPCIDLPHFVTVTDNGHYCMNGLFRVFENKENIISKAHHYFSRFIKEDKPYLKIKDWTFFLN